MSAKTTLFYLSVCSIASGQVYDIMYTDIVQDQYAYWGVTGFGTPTCCQATYIYGSGLNPTQGYLAVNKSYLIAWVGDPLTNTHEQLLGVNKGPGENVFSQIYRGDVYRYFSIGKPPSSPCVGENNLTALYARNDNRAEIIFGCLDITSGITFAISSRMDPYRVADQGGSGHFKFGGGLYDSERDVLWSTWHQDIPPYSHVQVRINGNGSGFQEVASEEATYGDYCVFSKEFLYYPCLVSGSLTGPYGYFSPTTSSFTQIPGGDLTITTFAQVANTTVAIAITSDFSVYSINLQSGVVTPAGRLQGTYLPSYSKGILVAFGGK
eukprot:TRINITY_DN31192_c0_g1_i1.p1 TRINITY_DN31192_c0_g1~~TRINITY_DN31192_c0_g1_i1.p1  ORF type:complete len:323 (+),score=-8.03 TRINITY_DN31192_c0_g1_i1:69-1037(+)